MSDLTPQQEQAIATFKTSMHFPGDGFHALIIDLCKTYQLSFQKVRKVLMSTQKAVEKKIRHQFDDVTADDLTQQAWLANVHRQLKDLESDNVTPIQTLQGNARYIKATSVIDAGITTEDVREAVLEDLFLAYEKVVFKPLASMLHTTPLYWKLMRAEEVSVMTDEYRLLFSDYPHHMQVTAQIFKLDQSVRALTLN
ncbi:hypothetical protein A9264_06830 [Vibrio sp. UCD-FRSSP16_10]|uniref:hypothetical protein n=1 Tax=unclassified Vibrio TaxID=2614977 RepID=UPI0007FFE3D2|nr:MULTISPECIES: hypothetical protein [unclassified Vibrio]OBT13376.1 hypothetical protein A9264_06830 [Vibrio sp. UCD-FRSSP16_10]OBT17886.1 hypothetical protein A9260_00820 [Vibrio sp. UCD-FRSSP16_30]